jgi:hypothetical protein
VYHPSSLELFLSLGPSPISEESFVESSAIGIITPTYYILDIMTGD